MAKILLIDDEEAVSAANQLALEAEGHRVWVTRTATDALAALPAVEPDAVVVETMVVGLTNGFAFADQLAQRLGAERVLVLTRADDFLDTKARREQDRDGWIRAARFMEKPLAPERLAEEVGHVLSGH